MLAAFESSGDMSNMEDIQEPGMQQSGSIVTASKGNKKHEDPQKTMVFKNLGLGTTISEPYAFCVFWCPQVKQSRLMTSVVSVGSDTGNHQGSEVNLQRSDYQNKWLV